MSYVGRLQNQHGEKMGTAWTVSLLNWHLEIGLGEEWAKLISAKNYRIDDTLIHISLFLQLFSSSFSARCRVVNGAYKHFITRHRLAGNIVPGMPAAKLILAAFLGDLAFQRTLFAGEITLWHRPTRLYAGNRFHPQMHYWNCPSL